MNPENQKIIRQRILEVAENLVGKLPEHPRHPKGRNPYAHIPKVIKDATGGISYKDLPDEMFNDVMQLIQYCEDNPF
jgi:hypothetical protein